MMKAIFGGLLEFEDQSKLMEFAENLDIKTSVKVLENAIEYGMKNGLYSLEEAYCLYMCIHKLKDARGPCHGYKEPSEFPEVLPDPLEYPNGHPYCSARQK